VEDSGELRDPAAEYRTADLAREAGISVRTLRFYRERRLLPPPRREGRVAWYGPGHLARLRTITALLERGHTLGGIADLIAAWENGRDVGDVLGLDAAPATGWAEETPVRLAPHELADSFGSDVTADNLATALDLGYVAVDGETVVHVSRRLLDASAALVREGVPLTAVLAAAREVRRHADALADLFTALVRTHLPTQPDVPATLDRLRPVAKTVVEAELALAMTRRVAHESGAAAPRGGTRRGGSGA
jgi:DNA-binding transcriptional MerR regulator